MDFTGLNRIVHRPSEKYILQELVQYQTTEEEPEILKDAVGNIIKKDKVGNIKKEWKDIVELEGVIQLKQKANIDNSGEESAIEYVGYFIPKKFNINTNKLSNYRVAIIRDYETVYLKIIEFNPNLFLRWDKHHYKMKFIEDKKYGKQ